MKPSEFEISLLVENYDKKNSRIFYDAEKSLISKLSTISISNFNSTMLRMEFEIMAIFRRKKSAMS